MNISAEVPSLGPDTLEGPENRGIHAEGKHCVNEALFMYLPLLVAMPQD